MGIFGWKLTKEVPQADTDRVKDLLARLDTEKKLRAKASEKLKIEIKKAKALEAKTLMKQQSIGKQQAIVHLKAAERYNEQMSKMSGARHSELKAIVDSRLEAAKNLGFDLSGTITETINKLI